MTFIPILNPYAFFGHFNILSIFGQKLKILAYSENHTLDQGGTISSASLHASIYLQVDSLYRTVHFFINYPVLRIYILPHPPWQNSRWSFCHLLQPSSYCGQGWIFVFRMLNFPHTLLAIFPKIRPAHYLLLHFHLTIFSYFLILVLFY